MNRILSSPLGALALVISLEDRGMVQTTEEFIEMAASGSSMSGQSYLVRCGNGVPVQSSQWLRAQLQDVRSAGRATSPLHAEAAPPAANISAPPL